MTPWIISTCLALTYLIYYVIFLRSYSRAFVILAVIPYIFPFFSNFWFHLKITRLTKGLKKLSRLETWKGIAENQNLSSLILCFLTILFIILPISRLVLRLFQNFLELIVSTISFISEKIELIPFISFTETASQICNYFIIFQQVSCLNLAISFIIASIASIILITFMLWSIVHGISFGYMVFIKLQNKYKKG